MDRITLTQAELEQKFRLALRFILLRKNWLAQALLNERTTEAAQRSKDAAIGQLAKELVENFAMSKHEVTRGAVRSESEQILARLRDRP